MGLRINKKTYSRTHGFQDFIYCRVERVLYKKVDGTLSYTLEFYTSEEGAERTFPYYLEDEPTISAQIIPYTSYLVIPSGSVSGSTILDVDDDGNEIHGQEINMPTVGRHFLTGSVDVAIPIYETRDIYNTITYNDYDEEGNLIEKERQEYSGSVTEQVDEEIVTKTRIEHERILSGSIYEVVYEYAREDLENFFGSGSIEDVV